jgi:hypothetical protein
MHTQGSETSQYLEEKRLISISLVAASESESAQTVETRFWMRQQCCLQYLVHLRGYKTLSVFSHKKLQIVEIAEAAGKRRPRR